MMNKGTLLRTIVDYYLQSGDFNGLPAYRMEPYSSKDLIDLIHEGLVETLSEHNVLNPHIKGFDLDISIEQHIENATGKNGQVCFYPTKKALSNVTVDSERPYTARLQKGCPQFEIIFFDIEILERYVNNPRYEMIDYGYKGSISVSEKYWKDDLNGEYVKEYGMAYKKDTKLVRAVAVFVRDLSMLSANTQMLWRSFQQCNQDEFLIEEGFIKNSIYGAFVTKHWIFSALLEEIQIINKQCDAMESLNYLIMSMASRMMNALRDMAIYCFQR